MPPFVENNLDFTQILQRVYNESNHTLRTEATATVVGSAQEVIISHVDDSIRLGDGTQLVTATADGFGRVGLDVSIVTGVITGSVSITGQSVKLKTQAFFVSDTPTKIPATSLVDRNSISIRVIGTDVVYFGDSSLSTSNGYPKYRYEEIILDIKDNVGVELYVVCESGKSSEVRILELA